MPSIESFDDGHVLAIGVSELFDPNNPDDPNKHTFKDMAKYLWAVRHPVAWHKSQGRKPEGMTMDEMLALSPRPFLVGVDTDD